MVLKRFKYLLLLLLFNISRRLIFFTYLKQKIRNRLIWSTYYNRGPAAALVLIDSATKDESSIFQFPDLSSFHYLCGSYSKALNLLERFEIHKRETSERFELDRFSIRLLTSSVFSPIGHSGLIDIYVKAKLLGEFGDDNLLIIGEKSKFANPLLVDYWSRYVPHISNCWTCANFEKTFSPLEESIGIIRTESRGLEVLAKFGSRIQLAWETSGRQSLLTLLDEHKENAYKVLSKQGFPKDAWFCGLHVRTGDDPLRTVRNADIETYNLAIDQIIDRGGWILRIGNKKMPQLAPRYGVIDLPYTSHNNALLNLFVLAEGKFLIGTGSGPQVIPLCFGKGVAIANWGPLLSRQWGKQDILLPKRYFLRKENRYLTPHERMSERFGYLESVDALNEVGITVEDNTPEELRDLVLEMLGCLDRPHALRTAAEKGQEEFDALAYNFGVYPSKIASVYFNI